jgi:hypothetical protein
MRPDGPFVDLPFFYAIRIRNGEDGMSPDRFLFDISSRLVLNIHLETSGNGFHGGTGWPS